MTHPLYAVSSIDGRYDKTARRQRQFFSEYALMKNRLWAMTNHFRMLSEHPDVPMRSLTASEHAQLVTLVSTFRLRDAKVIKSIADHPEVLAEAYQTILRSINYPNAYDALKSVSRGKRITLQDLHDFVRGLDDALVDQSTKAKMLALTSETYIGLAPILARHKSG